MPMTHDPVDDGPVLVSSLHGETTL